MRYVEFPVIDPVATGKNILSLRKEKGLTVRDLQEYFGFEEPQAIYRWQYGKTIPSVDNLFALSAVLDVPMEKILVRASFGTTTKTEQQVIPAASAFFLLLPGQSMKKFSSMRLTSFSASGLAITRMMSASSSASQSSAPWASIRSSR